MSLDNKLEIDFSRTIVESKFKLSNKNLRYIRKIEIGKIKSIFSFVCGSEFYESLKMLNPTDYENFSRKVVLDKRRFSLTISDPLTTKKYNVADCIYISKIKDYVRLTFRKKNSYENVIIEDNKKILDFIEEHKSYNESNIKVMKKFKRENFI